LHIALVLFMDVINRTRHVREVREVGESVWTGNNLSQSAYGLQYIYIYTNTYNVKHFDVMVIIQLFIIYMPGQQLQY
jgi:hypothetical protein